MYIPPVLASHNVDLPIYLRKLPLLKDLNEWVALSTLQNTTMPIWLHQFFYFASYFCLFQLALSLSLSLSLSNTYAHVFVCTLEHILLWGGGCICGSVCRFLFVFICLLVLFFFYLADSSGTYTNIHRLSHYHVKYTSRNTDTNTYRLSYSQTLSLAYNFGSFFFLSILFFSSVCITWVFYPTHTCVCARARAHTHTHTQTFTCIYVPLRIFSSFHSVCRNNWWF